MPLRETAIVATLSLSFHPAGFLLAEGLGSSPDAEARIAVTSPSSPLRALLQLRLRRPRRDAMLAALANRYHASFETIRADEDEWLGVAVCPDLQNLEAGPLYGHLLPLSEHVTRAFLSFRKDAATMRLETRLDERALDQASAVLAGNPDAARLRLSARVTKTTELSPHWDTLLACVQ